MVQSLHANNPSRIFSALPELLETQRDSFNDFLKEGIAKEFSKLSPIRVETKNLIAEFILDGENYQLISPTETPRECILKMKTYDCKLYIKGQIIYKTSAGTILHKTKSEWILVAHLPLMTKRGHFIINGSPRVIVQQVVRCPGIYFQETPDKDYNKKSRFYADIIPKRGVWLRVQLTKKGEIQAKFKKGKKIQAEVLQKCLQTIERQEELGSLISSYESFANSLSYSSKWIPTREENNSLDFSTRLRINDSSSTDKKFELNEIVPTNLINACVKKQTNLNQACIIRKRKEAELGVEDLTFSYTYDKLYRPAEDKEREQIALKNDIDAADLEFKAQKCYTNLFSTFKIESRYDLSDLGRQKINTKFGITLSDRQLTALDLQITRYWLQKYSKGEKRVDDIDHSKNRRIRTSGSLLQSQFEIGVERLKKFIWNKLKEFITIQLTEAESFEPGQSEADTYKNEVALTKTKLLHRQTQTFISSYIPLNTPSLLLKSGSTDLRVNGYDVESQTNDSKNFELLNVSAKRSWFSKSKAGLTKANTKSVKLPQHVSVPIFAFNKSKSNENLAKSTHQSFDAVQNKTSIKGLSQFKDNNFDLSQINRYLSLFSFSSKAGLAKAELLQTLSIKSTSFSKKFHSRTIDFKDEVTFEKQKLTNYTFNLYRKIQFSLRKKESISLKNIVSAKPITGSFREFFGSNPLSQYMDQTNPLAEITHKRRISSLGIGGVSRDSAGMAIRGIHATHYGRICPIETPEGKNAGLVNSLSFFAKVDNDGFIKTPYYKLFKGQIQNELGFAFFSAEQETAHNFCIAPSDLHKSCNNILQNNSVAVRVADNLLDLFKKIHPYAVDCIGISPIQMISVATSLIPFLEHNDANRALMGSNMQRQAVPLMIPERPLVGTGLEALVLAESGHITQSSVTGFVSYVSCNEIVVERINKLKFGFALQSLTASLSGLQNKSKAFARQLGFTKLRGSKQSGYISDFVNNKSIRKKVKRKNQIEQKRILPKLRVGNAYKDYFVAPLQLKETKIQTSKTLKRETAKLIQTFTSPYKNEIGLAKVKIFQSREFYSQTLQSKAKKHSLLQMQDFADQSNYSQSLHSQSLSKYQQVNPKFNIFCFDSKSVVFAKETGKAGAKAPLSQTLCTESNAMPFAFSKTSNTKNLFNLNSRKVFKSELASYPHVIQNFNRSNQDICLVERALVQEGEWVQQGDILTDCSASEKGELAVGKNVLLAYLPWEGYNFEDAIVISDRLVKENVYTSLHIERYDFDAQDFKEGNEWFTNDLPGIASKNVKHLDAFGLPKIGSFVKEGDILVGKIKYSNKKATTPYERLLCDILGEKNFAARDASLYLPRGVEARVIDYQLLGFFDKNPMGSPKEHFATMTTFQSKNKLPKVVNIFLGEKRPIQVGDKMSGRHGNKGVVSTILPRQDMPYLADGTAIDVILNPLGVPSRMNVGQVFECLLGLAATYLAQHFKITPFDETYGIEASQSLVYLKLYQARLQSGQNWLFQVDFPGKTRLIDGRSGEAFDQWVTVGKAYMLKLIHMVNEKIHARSTGPYALITQQPLRGRSQKGGQRLGEMEVWALQGFGAAYTLQELLTKKSDDTIGRKQIAASILPRPSSILETVSVCAKGQKAKPTFGMFTETQMMPSQSSNTLKEAKEIASRKNQEGYSSSKKNKVLLGQPEIFKVLVCELQALCLDIGIYTLTNQSFQRSFISIV